MFIENTENRRYFKSSLLESTGAVSHGFTTKLGGASCGKVEGLNLGFRVGDNSAAVRENYKTVARDLEMPYKAIVASRQTHSTNIRVVTADDMGKGVSRESDIFDTDALITNCAQIPLVVFYADCVPILMFDTKKRAAAAIHSGWRGTADKIAEKTVRALAENFGSQPEDILAAVGPSIGPCCFECGAEVAELFPDDIVSKNENGKFKVNLWQNIVRMFTDCGLRRENIEVFEQCTMCKSDIFYSYRKHKEKTGRMGAFIMIKG